MNRKEFLQETFKSILAALTIPYFSKLIHAEPTPEPADDKPQPLLGRTEIIAAAREIIAAQTYCALVTQDANGRPQIRTMNPFPPEDDMTVWIATSTQTRKAQHMRNNPNVTLYYSNHAEATGYVAITGHAELVDDRAEMIKRKRAYWDQAFPEFKNLVLIKVTPERLDVINYKAGAVNDPQTWRSPTVEFKKARNRSRTCLCGDGRLRPSRRAQARRGFVWMPSKAKTPDGKNPHFWQNRPEMGHP